MLPEIVELWGLNVERDIDTKITRCSGTEDDDPVFLLRCLQIGISLRDLDLVTIGTVNDMYAESDNDSYEYAEIASQEQMDLF